MDIHHDECTDDERRCGARAEREDAGSITSRVPRCTATVSGLKDSRGRPGLGGGEVTMVRIHPTTSAVKQKQVATRKVTRSVARGG